MSQELSTIRRTLAKVSSDLKLGQYVSVATAIREAARLFGRVPMLKAEQDEFTAMLKDCVDLLYYDKKLSELFPIRISYTPGQESALVGMMNELIVVLQEHSAEEAIARQKSNRDALMAKGKKELEDGHLAEAQKTFERLERDYPDDAELAAEIAELYIQMGLFDGSLWHLELSLKIAPDSPSLLNRLGIAYRRVKRYADAERCFSKALSLDQNDPNLFFNMGRLYLDLGEWEKARECAKQALALNADLGEAAKMAAYAERKLAK